MATKFTDKYPGQEVRALSWKQPFASLMLHGKVETRTWDTKYRGWVLICASKAPYNDRQINEISGDVQYKIMQTILTKNYYTIPIGEAFAIGRLIDSRRMGSLLGDRVISTEGCMEIENRTFVKINYSLFLHEYRDVQPIVPFEWKGSQGWKTLDESTKDKIILL